MASTYDDLFDSDRNTDRENVETEHRTRVPRGEHRHSGQSVQVPVLDGKAT